MKSFAWIALSGLAWLILLGAGTVATMRYELTPGPSRIGMPDWPSASRIERSDSGYALVMFVHPKCPCSGASIDELSRIVVRKNSRLHVYLLVLQPTGCAKRWADTGLVASARKIPGATVLFDPGGEEARRFHAATSGFTLLYDRTGKLLFSGGITAARGEAGDNAGSDSVISLLSHGGADRRHTAVFGCSLFGSSADDRKEKDPCLN